MNSGGTTGVSCGGTQVTPRQRVGQALRARSLWSLRPAHIFTWDSNFHSFGSLLLLSWQQTQSKQYKEEGRGETEKKASREMVGPWEQRQLMQGDRKESKAQKGLRSYFICLLVLPFSAYRGRNRKSKSEKGKDNNLSFITLSGGCGWQKTRGERNPQLLSRPIKFKLKPSTAEQKMYQLWSREGVLELTGHPGCWRGRGLPSPGTEQASSLVRAKGAGQSGFSLYSQAWWHTVQIMCKLPVIFLEDRDLEHLFQSRPNRTLSVTDIQNNHKPLWD